MEGINEELFNGYFYRDNVSNSVAFYCFKMDFTGHFRDWRGLFNKFEKELEVTPKEIISKHICAIEGMRIPYARMIVENILRDLEDEGYHVVDRAPEAHPQRHL